VNSNCAVSSLKVSPPDTPLLPLTTVAQEVGTNGMMEILI
jgi:hypothetical protein